MKHPLTVDGVMQFVVDNQPIARNATEATVVTEHEIHLVQLIKDKHQLVMTSENLMTTAQTSTVYDVDVWQTEAIINILQGIQKINNGVEALRSVRLEALSDSA